MFQPRRLLLLVIILITSGCFASSLSERSTAFAYSTYQGGIYEVDLSGQKRQIISADGILKEVLRWSPDQSYLTFVTSEIKPSGLRHELWIVKADRENARSLFGPVKALRYSWEGTHTVYLEEAISFERIPFDKDTAIRAYKINVDTGDVQEVEKKSNLFPLPLQSPNGEWASWTDPSDNKWVLYLLDGQGNKLSVIYQPPRDRMTNGVWSPDSQQLAILRPDNNELYIYTIANDNWSQVSSFASNHDNYSVADIQWSPDGKWVSYTLGDQKNARQICVLRLDERKEHCFDTKWSSNEYVWDQSSRYIAYLGKTSSGESDMFVIDVQERAIRNLTQDGDSAIETWIAH